ncbi:MAG: VOC family protein [Bradymonadales bacterium]|nr:VOC family protein [Bradymonadales bacterium]
MRLYSVTVPQRHVKYQMSLYFYGHILRLPHQTELDNSTTRWFRRPVYVVSQSADALAEEQPKGVFTGIQFNVSPPKDMKPIAAAMRMIGVKQSEPHRVQESWLMTLFDSTGNQLVVMGTEEPPDEPLIEKGVGSLSLFVTDIARARDFYLGALGLPLRADPYPGLVVIGDPSGTSLMVYQSSKANPNTPIGRKTGISFYSDDLPKVLSAVMQGGGMVIGQQPAEQGKPEIYSADFADPEGNSFTVIDQRFLEIPAYEPAATQQKAAQPDNPLGLELDSTPMSEQPPDAEEGYTFDRDLELD